MRYVSWDGACGNSGVAGADRLILGGVAELFGENGVVLLKE